MKRFDLKAPAATEIRITETTIIADFPRDLHLEFVPRLMAPQGRPLPASPLRTDKGVMFDHLDLLTLYEADKPVIQLVCWPERLITVLASGFRQNDLYEYCLQAAILFNGGLLHGSGKHLVYSILSGEEPLKNALRQERIPVADDARSGLIQRALQAVAGIGRK